MRTWWRASLIVLSLCLLAPAKDEALPELKAKADAAHGGEQAKLCLRYAHAELEFANQLFTKGDVEQAQSAVSNVMDCARKGADAARSSGKRLKQTEIELRELEKRMKDIGDSLDLDDRPGVLNYVKEIEQLRTGLLEAMFGSGAEPKDKS
jgi:hypothetical protein